MASYHAAFAAGGELVEYPMLDFPLALDMIGDQGKIKKGRLVRPAAPGIGVTLTPQMEADYPFDETASLPAHRHVTGVRQKEVSARAVEIGSEVCFRG